MLAVNAARCGGGRRRGQRGLRSDEDEEAAELVRRELVQERGAQQRGRRRSRRKAPELEARGDLRAGRRLLPAHELHELARGVEPHVGADGDRVKAALERVELRAPRADECPVHFHPHVAHAVRQAHLLVFVAADVTEVKHQRLDLVASLRARHVHHLPAALAHEGIERLEVVESKQKNR